ncbi:MULTISPECIES: hypothetical protein, partial [Emticicia]|uniref:hypothetical protein n=1 Tax=Emticicia TaxID=312278 RepID=UPI001E28D21B
TVFVINRNKCRFDFLGHFGMIFAVLLIQICLMPVPSFEQRVINIESANLMLFLDKIIIAPKTLKK